MDKQNKLYKISEVVEMEIFPFGYRTLLRKCQSGEIKAHVIKRNNLTGDRYYIRGIDLNKYYNKLIK